MSCDGCSSVPSCRFACTTASGEPPRAKESKCLTVLSNNVGILPPRAVALYSENVKEKKQHILADEEQAPRSWHAHCWISTVIPTSCCCKRFWSIKARDRLIKDLAGEYPYSRHPENISDGKTTIQASGLIIFCKVPIDHFGFKEFSKGFGLDKVARKGIVGIRLTKDGRKVAVFTVHLQAGGKRDPSVKPDQLRECNEFIREFTHDDKDVIVVLAGDFNIRSTDPAAYHEIFTHLTGARDSYQEGPGPKTTTRNEKHPEKRIDYLLTFGDVEAVSTIVDPAGDRISDHLAVFGTVSLE